MQPAEKISIQVSESIGKISALVVAPDNPKALIVLSHGAGAGMTHSFMEDLSIELARQSIVTIRFNFPYMENKKGRPDPPAIAEKTISVIIEKAHALYPALPLFVAGKSFGGRMSSQRLSKECPSYVKGIIFYGFPLHPIGQPGISRADHLKNVSVPLLFLQGTKDKLAEVSLIEQVCADLPLATLIKFEGADHSFKAGKQKLIPELSCKTVDWMNKL
ncbi:MAG: dienelactone hydrolase family protein [Bacteroidia bacterium]|nr:dienelactone hydrolase family protein [Bacteroidia bacterium]